MKDKRQLKMTFEPEEPSPIRKPKGCAHPRKRIKNEMLRDTCTQCGATRTVKPNGMLRIEGPWWFPPPFAAPTKESNDVDKRLTPADLSEDQREVFDSIEAWIGTNDKLLTVGGLGGSGKSTLIGVLAAKLSGSLVAYATYTGRASSVLARKLRAAGVHVTSHQAKPPDYKGRDPNRMFLDPHEMKLPFCGTLHKLLYRPVINDKEEITGWRKREELDRQYDLICVDESSMVGDDMLLDLQHHRVPILAVGDHGQLPPVMASGNLMAHPDLKLVKIHRQAKKNPIILFSRHVRKTGELDESFCDKKHIFFESKRNVDSVLTDAYQKVDSPLEVAIVCWTNRNRIRLNIAARKALGFKGAPHRGEVLICLKNMRDSNADIYNGMRGVVAADTFFIDGEWAFDCSVGFPEEGILPRNLSLCAPQFFRERVFGSVEELNDRGIDVDSMAGLALFDMGYALTTHKAQGCQAKHVIVWIEEGAQSDAKFWRKWLYTSVTRASEKLTILV